MVQVTAVPAHPSPRKPWSGRVALEAADGKNVTGFAQVLEEQLRADAGRVQEALARLQIAVKKSDATLSGDEHLEVDRCAAARTVEEELRRELRKLRHDVQLEGCRCGGVRERICPVVDLPAVLGAGTMQASIGDALEMIVGYVEQERLCTRVKGGGDDGGTVLLVRIDPKLQTVLGTSCGETGPMAVGEHGPDMMPSQQFVHQMKRALMTMFDEAPRFYLSQALQDVCGGTKQSTRQRAHDMIGEYVWEQTLCIKGGHPLPPGLLVCIDDKLQRVLLNATDDGTGQMRVREFLPPWMPYEAFRDRINLAVTMCDVVPKEAPPAPRRLGE